MMTNEEWNEIVEAEINDRDLTKQQVQAVVEEIRRLRRYVVASQTPDPWGFRR